MYNQQPRGWIEILFHLGKNSPSPSSFEDLKQNEYMQVGSCVPIQEVNGPYDIYQMLYEKAFPNMPRAVRSFDLINVVQQSAPRVTFAIVSPHLDRDFLTQLHHKTKKTAKCACWPQFPHGLMIMPEPFSSFSGGVKK